MNFINIICLCNVGVAKIQLSNGKRTHNRVKNQIKKSVHTTRKILTRIYLYHVRFRWKRSAAVKTQNIPTHIILTCATLHIIHWRKIAKDSRRISFVCDCHCGTQTSHYCFVCMWTLCFASCTLSSVHILWFAYSDFALFHFGICSLPFYFKVVCSVVKCNK